MILLPIPFLFLTVLFIGVVDEDDIVIVIDIGRLVYVLVDISKMPRADGDRH